MSSITVGRGKGKISQRQVSCQPPWSDFGAEVVVVEEEEKFQPKFQAQGNRSEGRLRSPTVSAHSAHNAINAHNALMICEEVLGVGRFFENWERD